MRKSCISCIICLCVISCNSVHKKQDGMEYVKNTSSLAIDTSRAPIAFDLKSDIRNDIYECIDSVFTIALETTDQSLIGRMDHIQLVQSKIFVTDLYKSKSIFVFDEKGKYLYQIGKVGQGPGEYTSLNVVRISDKYVDVLDWISWKFIRYDLEGKWIAEYLLMEQSPTDVFELTENNWLLTYQQYTAKHPYRLVFADSVFSTRQTALSFENDRKHMPGKLHPTTEGDLLYYYPLCDTVFQITESAIVPKYCLSLYERGEVQSFMGRTQELSQRDFSDRLWRTASNGIVSNFDFYVAEEFYYATYQRYPYVYSSLVDKHTLKSRNYLCADMKNNKTDFPFHIYACYGNWLLSCMDESYFSLLSASEQERIYKYIKNDADIARIKERKQSPENNPVICLFRVNMHFGEKD